MATLQQLETALKNADAAGDMDAARKLAAVISRARQDVSNQIPDTVVPETQPQYIEPSIGEKIVGAGETALTLGTGATSGTVGMIGGTLKGLAEQILSGQFGTPEAANAVEQSAMKGAQALTYAPRTQSGQEQVQAVGEVLQNVPPVIPVVGPIGAVATSTKMAAPVVAATAGAVTLPAVATIKRLVKPAQQITTSESLVRPSVQVTAEGKLKAAEYTGDNAKSSDAVVNPLYKPSAVNEQDLGLSRIDFERAGVQQVPVKNIISPQDNVNPRKVNRIASEFNSTELDPIYVVKSGNEYTVLQGNHRVIASEMRGIDSIPAHVIEIPTKKPTPGTAGSMGAAGVDIATQRAMKAEELPVPIKLTEGQKTRQFEDVRFERETAKLPEVGEPLRERFAQQNQQLRQNLDAFIDMTGAQAGESEFRRATGMAVNEALRSRAARDKAKIRVLYKEAEKAGELASPADLSPIADYLNQNRAGRSSAPIMGTFAEELKVQGVGSGSLADGTLQIGEVSLGQAEALRKAINRFVKSNDPNDVRVASELKQLIDTQTEGLGGNLYQQARAARARYAADYENIGLVKNLLGFKRGSTDRAIALEEVLNRSIIDPGTSLDTVRQIRRLLQTEGPKGMQAWKELQGGTLQYIKEEALRNVAPDQFGNRIVSPAQLDRVITNLDKNGKLDFVFGKKGAEQLRTINDVAKDVLTVPPGTVNTSNTASVLAGLMDVAISGTSGVPAPIMTGARLLTKSIKDAKTRAKVRQALGG